MQREIQREINQCRRHIQLLTNLDDKEAARTWFKELCLILTTLLIHVRRQLQALKDTPTHFTQITKYLSLLIPIFSSHEFTETFTIRSFIQKQLILYLDKIEEAPPSASSDENFMNQIDSSLEKLDLIDVNEGRTNALSNYQSARRQIEQALCHAMSIAHIAYCDDFQAIKGGCKSVLNALDSLHEELQNASLNVAMCNLSIDSSYDKLCNLERRVNTAVLTLCLKIFSQYDRPLQLLYDESYKQSMRSDEDIRGLTADFDLQVDRIMQIGLFAIASSPDSSCSVKIQNHLTCLEALEGELVPSLRAFMLDKSQRNACLIEALKGHWLNEVEELKRALYSVIDPFAFGQIALEELRQSLDVVFERARNHKGALKVDSLETITDETETLIDVVTISFGSTGPPVELEKLLENLKLVLREVKAAIQILLVESEASKDGCFRIEKRCKIMLSLIKKIVVELAKGSSRNATVISEQSCRKTEANAPAFHDETKRDEDNKSLNQIINKGKKILKDRSMLHKTPMKVTFFTGLDNTSSSNANKRSFHLSYSKVRDGSSIDLQLTEILGSISTSFNQISLNHVEK